MDKGKPDYFDDRLHIEQRKQKQVTGDAAGRCRRSDASIKLKARHYDAANRSRAERNQQ